MATSRKKGASHTKSIYAAALLRQVLVREGKEKEKKRGEIGGEGGKEEERTKRAFSWRRVRKRKQALGVGKGGRKGGEAWLREPL